jgi:hypothetical protein
VIIFFCRNITSLSQKTPICTFTFKRQHFKNNKLTPGFESKKNNLRKNIFESFKFWKHHRPLSGLPDLSRWNTPKRGKMYQMTTKYSKRT